MSAYNVKIYYQTFTHLWVEKEEYEKQGSIHFCKKYDKNELLNMGGFYGQYLPDGTLEKRSDLISVPIK